MHKICSKMHKLIKCRDQMTSKSKSWGLPVFNYLCRRKTCIPNSHTCMGGGGGVIRSTYGAARMRARKDAVVSAETTGSGSRFHSGIVRGKYDFRYCSQWVVRWQNLWGWLLLVCLSALVRWLAALIATSPFTLFWTSCRGGVLSSLGLGVAYTLYSKPWLPKQIFVINELHNQSQFLTGQWMHCLKDLFRLMFVIFMTTLLKICSIILFFSWRLCADFRVPWW